MRRERMFDSETAYLAAVEFIGNVARRLQSENLTMLASVMDLLEFGTFGDSTDPAMLAHWRELWSDKERKSELDTLEFVARFICKEGVWDPEDAGPETLRSEVRDYLAGAQSGSVLADWNRAVSVIEKSMI